MWRRKRLVQIHVNNIETHVARPDLAEDRIEICAVVIQQAAGIVNQLAHFQNLLFKYTQRRGIGQHDP